MTLEQRLQCEYCVPGEIFERQIKKEGNGLLKERLALTGYDVSQVKG